MLINTGDINSIINNIGSFANTIDPKYTDLANDAF